MAALLTHEQKVLMREAIELMPDKIVAIVASEVAIAIYYVIQNGDEHGDHWISGAEPGAKWQQATANIVYVQEKVDKLRAAGGTGKDLKIMASVLMCSPNQTTESWAKWSKWVNWYGPDLKRVPLAPSRSDLPVVRTARCRFMYEILPEWRALVDAATSRHFLDASYPSLPDYVQKRWDAIPVEEKWNKYGKPFADERDAISKAKGKNWSETSRLETAPGDSEDECCEVREPDGSSGSSRGPSDDSDTTTDLDEPIPKAATAATASAAAADAAAAATTADTWWFMRQGGEPIYVAPKEGPFEEDYLALVRDFHRINQDRQPRPARIATMFDWPFPLPFKPDDRAVTLLASDKVEDLSHKRCFAVQRYRMELEGALGWMDFEFHPFANACQRLGQLLNRNRYLTLSEAGPKVNTSRYHRAVAQIRDCHSAVNNNDPGAFLQAMPVFSERVFADESQSLQNDTHLSGHFADMLLTFREAVGKAKKMHDWAPIVATAEMILKAKVAAWVPVINELAAKADCIGAMVVDALCVGTGQAACENFGDYVFNEDVFPCARALRNVAFTDATAPLFLTSYWEKRPGFALNLEASSRIACTLSPRARFADTKYTESLRGLLKAHEVFVARRRVRTDGSFAIAFDGVMHRCDAPARAVRFALKDSIACGHYTHWTSQQMIYAGCTLLLYARRMRRQLVWYRKVQARVSDVFVQEIYVNVDQALELFDLVHARERTHVKRGEHTPMQALPYLYEARKVRAHWMDEDAKYGRHTANLAREERKKCKRRIADCAKNAVLNVLADARIRDNELKIRANEERMAIIEAQDEANQRRIAANERRIAARECIARYVSWMPDVVRRKAVFVQRRMDEQAREAREKAEAKARDEARARGLAIAIERNRAAVVRREGAPARRAEEQKRWAKEVAKEAADQKAKEKLERAAKFKAEQAERATRLKAEAEEAERARVAGKAKLAAEAAAEARIAAAAAAVERQRQQAEALEAARLARAAAQAASEAKEAEMRRRREEAEEKERRRVQRETNRVAAETAKAERARQRKDREEAERRYWEAEKRKEAQQLAINEMEAKRERASMAKALQAFRDNSRLRFLLLQHDVRARIDFFGRVYRTKAFKLWRARARATHAARALRKPKPKPKPKPPTPPPPPAPTPPPAPAPAPVPAEEESDEALVDRLSERPHATSAKWQEDYRNAITAAQQESQRQLYNKCGWASGYDGWFMMGGWDLVNAQTRARQQHDMQLATFQANFKLQQRMQHLQLKQAKQIYVSSWKSAAQRFSDKMAELDAQRAQVEQMEERIAELESQRIKLRDRAQARMMQLEFDAEAAATEQAGLSAELCERLRNRPAAGPGVSLAVDECLLCMNDNCTHIARVCFHVIGCRACCEMLNVQLEPKCPICQTPTTFTAMRLP